MCYAYPRYGVEGLWEYIIAGLISSTSLLQFLFIRKTKQNMNLRVEVLTNMNGRAASECVRTWLWVLCGLPQSPGLLRA